MTLKLSDEDSRVGTIYCIFSVGVRAAEMQIFVRSSTS
jgi:hypothetical protein